VGGGFLLDIEAESREQIVYSSIQQRAESREQRKESREYERVCGPISSDGVLPDIQASHEQAAHP
jgi:hypothetical protein